MLIGEPDNLNFDLSSQIMLFSAQLFFFLESCEVKHIFFKKIDFEILIDSITILELLKKKKKIATFYVPTNLFIFQPPLVKCVWVDRGPHQT